MLKTGKVSVDDIPEIGMNHKIHKNSDNKKEEIFLRLSLLKGAKSSKESIDPGKHEIVSMLQNHQLNNRKGKKSHILHKIITKHLKTRDERKVSKVNKEEKHDDNCFKNPRKRTTFFQTFSEAEPFVFKNHLLLRKYSESNSKMNTDRESQEKVREREHLFFNKIEVPLSSPKTIYDSRSRNIFVNTKYKDSNDLHFNFTGESPPTSPTENILSMRRISNSHYFKKGSGALLKIPTFNLRKGTATSSRISWQSSLKSTGRYVLNIYIGHL